MVLISRRVVKAWSIYKQRYPTRLITVLGRYHHWIYSEAKTYCCWKQASCPECLSGLLCELAESTARSMLTYTWTLYMPLIRLSFTPTNQSLMGRILLPNCHPTNVSQVGSNYLDPSFFFLLILCRCTMSVLCYTLPFLRIRCHHISRIQYSWY